VAAASAALRRLYAKNKRGGDLAKLLRRLIDVAPSPADRTTLRIELSKLLTDDLGQASDAMETLRAILEEEPGQADAVVLLSQLYEKGGKDDELADLLSSQINLAKERNDVSAELVFKVRLGEIYETRLKDAGKAIETYRGVLEREPGHKGALSALARLYEGKADSAEASNVLAKLLDVETGAEAVAVALRLAEAQAKQKNDAGVRDALERALTIEPQSSDVRERLRKLYEKTGDWEKLANLYAGDAESATTDADRVRLLRDAAQIHRDKRQDAAAAATLLEKASTLMPDDRELLLALCDAYSSSGRAQDAVQALERVKESYGGKRSKDLATVHQRLAQAYRAQGDKDKALSELDSAFKIDPGSVATLRDLGLLTLEVGDLERAQKTFRALLLQKLDPPAPITKAEVFYYLGEISHRQGDKAKAIQMLDRAVENDGGMQKAKDLLAQLK
jgi:golgin subfamily B member 1